MHQIVLPKGPRSPAIIQAAQFFWNPYHFLKKCAKRYGDIFTIKLPGFGRILVLNDPQLIKQVFTEQAQVLVAGRVSRVFFEKSLGEYSLLNMDDEPHLRHRKIILPPLRGKTLDGYAETMLNITKAVSSTWEDKSTIQMLPEFKKITLRIIMKVIYGLEESDTLTLLEQLITQLLQAGEKPFLSYITGLFPKLNNNPPPSLKRLLKQIKDIILRHIKTKRDILSDDSVLSMYLQAVDEKGKTLSDEEIRDELFTLLLAGHETTALTLSWVLYYIISNPMVYQRVKRELDEHAIFTKNTISQDIRKLTYLDAVIKESQRIRPIVPTVARQAIQSVTIGNYHIPANMVIMACLYLSHIRQDSWHEPEKFNPERFLENKETNYTFYPFGGGIRRCVGAAFANLEMRLVLAYILTEFDFKLASGYLPKVVRQGTAFGPSKHFPVNIKKLDEPKNKP